MERLAEGNIDDLLFRVRGLQNILSPMFKESQRIAVENEQTVALVKNNRSNGQTTQVCAKGIQDSEIPFVQNVLNEAEKHAGSNGVRQHQELDIDETIELLRLVTFVRVVVDTLHWEGRPPALFRQEFSSSRSPRDRGQLILDYEFPTPDSDKISQTLRKRVRTVARTVLPSVAHFNHRRVALVQVTQSIAQLWSKTYLTLRIYYQFRNIGKFATRQVGKVEVWLADLLSAPFSIQLKAPLDAVGCSSCRGYLSLSIQLGSRNALFSDRVQAFRCSDPLFDTHQRAEIDSNSVSTRFSRTTIPIVIPEKHISPSINRRISVSEESDNFLDADQTKRCQTIDDGDMIDRRKMRKGGTVADRLRGQLVPADAVRGYRVLLTVHSARRLPLVKGRDIPSTFPNVYVSYRGEEKLQCSPIIYGTSDPNWEWTTELYVPFERKNLVLKVWHRCPSKGDQVLGFVCIDLPLTPATNIQSDYDLVDLSESSSGRLKISIRLISSGKWGHAKNMNEMAASMVKPLPQFMEPPLPPIEPYFEMASRSLLAEQLRKNMEQLETCMQRLPL